jgi:hypothetical protein
LLGGFVCYRSGVFEEFGEELAVGAGARGIGCEQNPASILAPQSKNNLPYWVAKT